MKEMLLRFARQIVQAVMGQLMQQLNVLMEQALNPVKTIIQAIVGGAWIGKGADALVEELNSLLIPQLNLSGDNIKMTHGNLQKATDIIDQGDEKANQLAKSAADLFGQIYNG